MTSTLASIRRGTLVGSTAVLLWGTLATLTVLSGDIPPFQLLAMAFTLATLIGFLPALWRRLPTRTSRAGPEARLSTPRYRLSPAVWALGIYGLFGYHFAYFMALRLAPPIVVLSPLILPGYRLGSRHVLGALLGLAGAALIATGGRFNLQAHYLTGYLLAGATALTWALYSLLTKRLPRFSTETVAVFCLISAALAWGVYFATGGSLSEMAAQPPRVWLALALVGLGPMGAAFYLWDAALKRGDPRVIGSLAYLTPLLSTLNLIVFGGQRMTWVSGAAMALIICGALISAWKVQQSRLNPHYE